MTWTTMKESKESKREKRRVTLRDVFNTYPYKIANKKDLIKGGSEYFPKEQIVNDHKFSVNRKDFMEVAQKLFKYRFDVLLRGEEIVLPLRSGTLQLVKYKPNRKSCDFKATRLYRENNPGSDAIIYHKNYHTQGYKPMLKWVKKNCAIINKNIFMFQLTRDKKRELAAYFKSNPKEINNLNTVL